MNDIIENRVLSQRVPTRLRYYDYNNAGAYFVTICTMGKKCILSKIVGTGVLDCPQPELTEYGKIAEKYIKSMGEFYKHISIDGYVIMPNHIHIMLVIKECETIKNDSRSNSAYSRFVSTFKRFCNKEYGRNIWQARSNDHIIRNEHDYEKHMKYIYENPLKWTSDEMYINEVQL